MVGQLHSGGAVLLSFLLLMFLPLPLDILLSLLLPALLYLTESYSSCDPGCVRTSQSQDVSAIL